MKRLLFISLLSVLACSFVAAGQFRSKPMGKDTLELLDSILEHNMHTRYARYCTDVDSYFQANFSYIRGKLCRAPSGTNVIQPRHFCAFMYVVGELSGHTEWWAETLILMRAQTIDEWTLEKMEQWYAAHKCDITREDVLKACVCLDPFIAEVPDSLLLEWLHYAEALDGSIEKKQEQ